MSHGNKRQRVEMLESKQKRRLWNVEDYLIQMFTECPGFIIFEYLSDPEHFMTALYGQPNEEISFWLWVDWRITVKIMNTIGFISINLAKPCYYNVVECLQQDDQILSCKDLCIQLLPSPRSTNSETMRLSEFIRRARSYRYFTMSSASQNNDKIKKQNVLNTLQSLPLYDIVISFVNHQTQIQYELNKLGIRVLKMFHTIFYSY